MFFISSEECSNVFQELTSLINSILKGKMFDFSIFTLLHINSGRHGHLREIVNFKVPFLGLCVVLLHFPSRFISRKVLHFRQFSSIFHLTYSCLAKQKQKNAENRYIFH